MPPANMSPGPSSAPTNSIASTTKTRKPAMIGQKRALVEKTDNETNSGPTKKKILGRKAAQAAAQAAAAAPIEVPTDEENMDEDGSSSLSRSSGLSVASKDRMNLRPKPKPTPKTRTFDILADT